jgi:uncharacterized protein
MKGFANLDPARRKELASLGGKAAHAAGKAHTFTSAEARAAGKKGGATTSADRGHMSDIGRKGGLAVSSDTAHMSDIGRKGGLAVSSDTAHMSDVGRKGGLAVSSDTAHMSAIGTIGGSKVQAARRSGQ